MPSRLFLPLLLCLTLLAAATAGPNKVPKQPLPPGAVRAVVTRGAAMRTAPSRTAPIMHHVEQGLSVAVYGTENGFYAAQLRNGRQGWIPANALRLARPLPAHSFSAH